jgi:hypothetical protein
VGASKIAKHVVIPVIWIIYHVTWPETAENGKSTAGDSPRCLLSMLLLVLTKGSRKKERRFNLLTPKLNPSSQRCLLRFFTGILIFKGHTARRLYKSFGVKGLI